MADSQAGELPSASTSTPTSLPPRSGPLTLWLRSVATSTCEPMDLWTYGPICLWTLPGPRMRLAVHLEQVCAVHMGVALRRAEARVAQHLLNPSQVGAAVEQ